MIHATRPFVVNEWIQTKIEGYEVSGTVEVCKEITANRELRRIWRKFRISFT